MYRFIPLVLAACTPISAHHLPPPRAGGITVFRPYFSNYAFPNAADHRVVLVERDAGSEKTRSVLVTRAGPWVREERTTSGVETTNVSNLATTLSYYYSRGKDGRYAELSISGSRSGTNQLFVRTAQTFKLLGETCTVLAATRLIDGAPDSRKLDPRWTQIEKVCLTQDAIVLWWQLSDGAGHEQTSARAVSVSRRKLRAADVAPPADMLKTSYWMPPRTDSASDPNDEVFLAGTRGETLVIRRAGSTTMSDGIELKYRVRRFLSGGVLLVVHDTMEGTLYNMSIGRADREHGSDPFGRGVPLEPTVTKTILGEICMMVDMAPGVSDYSQQRCLTTNGRILEQLTTNHGGGPLLVATRVVRGEVKLREVMPPDDILTRQR